MQIIMRTLSHTIRSTKQLGYTVLTPNTQFNLYYPCKTFKNLLNNLTANNYFIKTFIRIDVVKCCFDFYKETIKLFTSFTDFEIYYTINIKNAIYCWVSFTKNNLALKRIPFLATQSFILCSKIPVNNLGSVSRNDIPI